MLENGEQVSSIKLLLDDVRVQLIQRPINTGRLCRGQYLLSVLALLLISSIIQWSLLQFPFLLTQIIAMVAYIITVVVFLGLSIRRINDFGSFAGMYLKVGIFLFFSSPFFSFVSSLMDVGLLMMGFSWFAILAFAVMLVGIFMLISLILWTIFSVGMFFVASKMPENQHGFNPLVDFKDISNWWYVGLAVILIPIILVVSYYTPINYLGFYLQARLDLLMSDFLYSIAY